MFTNSGYAMPVLLLVWDVDLLDGHHWTLWCVNGPAIYPDGMLWNIYFDLSLITAPADINITEQIWTHFTCIGTGLDTCFDKDMECIASSARPNDSSVGGVSD